MRSLFFMMVAACAACAAPVASVPGAGVRVVVGPESEPSAGASEAFFSVRGTVTQGLLAAPPAAPLEVGVLWLNWLENSGEVLVEATPADAIGVALPAAFDVSVLRAPGERMLGTTLVSYDEGGGSLQPVERNRVAFGVVVVARQGTFAGLPQSVSMAEFISASDAEPGPMLSSFTYVSPFTVRYVKGASAEGISIRDINGVASTLEDFTVFDVGVWARGIEAAVCRDRKLGEGWSTAEVNACIAEDRASNDAALACREACGTPAEGLDEDTRQDVDDCRVSCPAERTIQDIENSCLYLWYRGQEGAVGAACGPQPDPAAADFRNSRRLSPSEPLTLPLDDGDIRGALTYGGFIFLG